MSYLLDTNVFIAANRLHYGLDFCPAFWDWICHQAHTGLVRSIDKVADEIKTGKDDLSEWVENIGSHIFYRTPSTLGPHFANVSQWVSSQPYNPAAVNTFLQDADYYLVVHALEGDHTLITHEVTRNSRNRIKIPDVCLGLDIRFMTPYQMLRKERARFILSHNRF